MALIALTGGVDGIDSVVDGFDGVLTRALRQVPDSSCNDALRSCSCLLVQEPLCCCINWFVDASDAIDHG